MKTLVAATFVAASLLTSATALSAAGSSSFEPPEKTETTFGCTEGYVWHLVKKMCLAPESDELTDDTRYEAARELAYDGQLTEAQRVLAAMADQEDDRVLTYMGFTSRKMGDVEMGMSFYDRALAKNPDNILTRSYKGQAHIEAGDIEAARAELAEIEARGGAGTWPATSLQTAIETGKTYDF